MNIDIPSSSSSRPLRPSAGGITRNRATAKRGVIVKLKKEPHVRHRFGTSWMVNVEQSA